MTGTLAFALAATRLVATHDPSTQEDPPEIPPQLPENEPPAPDEAPVDEPGSPAPSGDPPTNRPPIEI